MRSCHPRVPVSKRWYPIICITFFTPAFSYICTIIKVCHYTTIIVEVSVMTTSGNTTPDDKKGAELFLQWLKNLKDIAITVQNEMISRGIGVTNNQDQTEFEYAKSQLEYLAETLVKNEDFNEQSLSFALMQLTAFNFEIQGPYSLALAKKYLSLLQELQQLKNVGHIINKYLLKKYEILNNYLSKDDNYFANQAAQLEQMILQYEKDVKVTVEIIKTYNVPHVVDFKDLGDKEKGHLIGGAGCVALREIMKTLPIGRYSKDFIKKKINTYKSKLPKAQRKAIEDAMPYIPSIIKEYNYTLRMTPKEPNDCDPNEVCLYLNKDSQLCYAIKGDDNNLITGIIPESQIVNYEKLHDLLTEYTSQYKEKKAGLTAEKQNPNSTEASLSWIEAEIKDLKKGRVIHYGKTQNEAEKKYLESLFSYVSRQHPDKVKPALHAIYRGKSHSIGAGAFGSVKAAFYIDEKDNNQNKFEVVKIQEKPDKAYLYEDEEKALRDLKQGSGILIKRQKRKWLGLKLKKEQYHLTMDYSEGVSLDQFLKLHPNLPAVRLLDIAIQITGQLNIMHTEYKHIHRDIKLENIIYDPVTGKISIVDAGLVKTKQSTYDLKKIPEDKKGNVVTNKLQPRTIYLKQKPEGLEYWVGNPDYRIMNRTILWTEFPEDFPKDVDLITDEAERKKHLQIILDKTSKRGGALSLLSVNSYQDIDRSVFENAIKSNTPILIKQNDGRYVIYCEDPRKGWRMIWVDNSDISHVIGFDRLPFRARPETLHHSDERFNESLIRFLRKYHAQSLVFNDTSDETVVLGSSPAGTPNYMPPEVLISYETGREMPIEYSEKTDAFSLGVTLKELFGFIVYDRTRFTHLFFKDKENKSQNNLSSMMKALTSSDPSKRPELSDVKNNLQELRDAILSVEPKIIGLLNVSDYMKANKEEKTAFILGLSSADVVVLVDDPNSQNHSPAFYSEFRQRLLNEGLIVAENVYRSASQQALVNQIMAEQSVPINGITPITHLYYFHPKNKLPMHANDVMSINVSEHSSPDLMRMREHSVEVTSAHLTLVKEKLIENQTRLIAQGHIPNKSKALIDIEANIAQIEKYQRIESGEEPGKKITYITLFSDLRKWENKVLKERTFTLNRAPQKRAAAIHEVSDTIRGEVQNATKVKIQEGMSNVRRSMK